MPTLAEIQRMSKPDLVDLVASNYEGTKTSFKKMERGELVTLANDLNVEVEDGEQIEEEQKFNPLDLRA